MNSTLERRIEPTDIPLDEQRKLRRLFEGVPWPRLTGPDGDEIELPDALNNLFVYLLGVMATQQAIILIPEEEAFTTQAAANFLGMSRPYLLRLIKDGALPFHRVGTHRRITFKDLLDYRRKRSEYRNAGLSKMTKTLVEAGLYDSVPDPGDTP